MSLYYNIIYNYNYIIIVKNTFVYTAHAQVKVGNLLSDHLQIGRGTRQGSVMFPSLFNLVIDPLLIIITDLKSKNLGLSIHGLFWGAFAHADDTRIATTNHDDTAEQVKTVASSADKNGLKLSTEKCGIVIAGRDGECIGVVSGYCCKEVYIDFLIIFILSQIGIFGFVQNSIACIIYAWYVSQKLT